ncbi:MAG: hypothetical protein KAR05_04070 [Candidatus Omnitrophica bacterium]|nr:hypothetical protein [Candidatus Omnitrophota bacterium]
MEYTKKHFSTRKISETLLDFAKPVFDKLEGDCDKETLENGLMLAVTVWNSLVLDKRDSTSQRIVEFVCEPLQARTGLMI